MAPKHHPAISVACPNVCFHWQKDHLRIQDQRMMLMRSTDMRLIEPGGIAASQSEILSAIYTPRWTMQPQVVE